MKKQIIIIKLNCGSFAFIFPELLHSQFATDNNSQRLQLFVYEKIITGKTRQKLFLSTCLFILLIYDILLTSFWR